MNHYIDDIFYDSGKGVVTTRELARFLDRNLDTVFDDLGISQYIDYNEGHEDLLEYILDCAETIDIERVSSLDTYREDYGWIFTLVSILFSYPIIIILLAEALILAFIILVKNNLGRSTKTLGISLLVVSLIYIVIPLTMKIIIPFYAGGFVLGEDLLKLLSSYITSQLLIVGGILFGASAIMIGISKIYKVVQKRRMK